MEELIQNLMDAYLSSERQNLRIYAVDYKDLKRIKGLAGAQDSDQVPGLLPGQLIDEEQKLELPKYDPDDPNSADPETAGTHTTKEDGDDSDTTDQGFEDVSY